MVFVSKTEYRNSYLKPDRFFISYNAGLDIPKITTDNYIMAISLSIEDFGLKVKLYIPICAFD